MLSFAIGFIIIGFFWVYRKSIKENAKTAEQAVTVYNEDWKTNLMVKASDIKADRKSKGLDKTNLDKLIQELKDGE